MAGYLALVLHAHLPFVRHPEHDRFLEETWLFEAITEAYLPLLRLLRGWQRDGFKPKLTLTLTPTLCSMLGDPLLQARYEKHLDDLIALAAKETHRTTLDPQLHELALFYQERLTATRELYHDHQRDLVAAFRQFQDQGSLEIIASAATHALLPLLADHLPSLRAQVFVARDHYRACFGRDPRGFWLPECAYVEHMDPILQDANIRWIITDSHGVLHAQPQPRYATFAPIITPNGLAVFGRDAESAREVWSRNEGYPGDPRYRDFYRDIGFDLEFDYVKPYLPSPDHRGFTGIKYHRITGGAGDKQLYSRPAALSAAEEHAERFLAARRAQLQPLAGMLDRPPLIVAPYDAELFGHWWYEGPEFLDFVVRQAAVNPAALTLITPGDYLRSHPTNQVVIPSASSWGEEGYWRVWLNEKNEWIYPHLRVAQERMTELVRRSQSGTAFAPAPAQTVAPASCERRALKQAGRELLLAQASDWPFILRAGTSPDYARQRVKAHLLRFTGLYEQIMAASIDREWLQQIESRDNIFPDLECGYWA